MKVVSAGTIIRSMSLILVWQRNIETVLLINIFLTGKMSISIVAEIQIWEILMILAQYLI